MRTNGERTDNQAFTGTRAFSRQVTNRHIGTSADSRWTGSLYGEGELTGTPGTDTGIRKKPIMTQTGERAARETTLNFNQTQLTH